MPEEPEEFDNVTTIEGMFPKMSEQPQFKLEQKIGGGECKTIAVFTNNGIYLDADKQKGGSYLTYADFEELQDMYYLVKKIADVTKIELKL